MKKERLLFVTGIPRGTTAQEIISNFALFGMYIKVANQRSEYLDAASRLQKGFCIIQMQSEDDYRSLLEMRRVKCFGRWLILKPCLTGASLCKENRRNNRRRILIKQVPAFIPDEQVFTYIRKNFGVIEEFYRLKSFQPAPRSIKSSLKAYSVMLGEALAFEFKEPLKLEIIPSIKVVAELFCPQKKGKTRQESSSQLEPKKYQKELRSEGIKYSTDQTPKLYYKQKSLPVLSPDTHQSSALQKGENLHSRPKVSKPELRSKSAARGVRYSCGYQQSIFNESLLAESHHLKPNSPVYRLLRAHNPEYLGTFELRYSWTSLTNQRNNICLSKAESEAESSKILRANGESRKSRNP